jgi:hypothetical protein
MKEIDTLKVLQVLRGFEYGLSVFWNYSELGRWWNLEEVGSSGKLLGLGCSPWKELMKFSQEDLG